MAAVYGRAMNTFWGCEPEALTVLSVSCRTAVARLRQLIERILEAAHAAAWHGPDAEEHRRRTDETAEAMTHLLEALRRFSEQLCTEADEQTACSRADELPGGAGDPLGVWASPPWTDEPGLAPPLSGAEPQGWGPMIGGPMAPKDPLAYRDRLPDLPALEDLLPLLGGPFQAEDLPIPPAPRPLPQDDGLGPDPEVLAEAQRMRRIGLGAIPFVGTAQSVMTAHTAVSDMLDSTEQNLRDSGLRPLAPIVSAIGIPNAIGGIAVGEKSVPGQVLAGIDTSIANTMQTTGEITSALGDGDLAGAVGAGERGMYRQAGVTADLLTATPFAALTDTAADVIDTGADMVEAVDPEAAEPLRQAEGATRQLGESWEAGRERLTDPDGYYAARRQYAPMPWDPQE